MIATNLIVLAETALPLIGALVIGIMVIIHRRGRARVAGILGAVLIVVGIIFWPVVGIVGMRPSPIAPGAMTSGFYDIAVLDFSLQAAPEVMLGLGVILVVASVVKGRQSRRSLG